MNQGLRRCCCNLNLTHSHLFKLGGDEACCSGYRVWPLYKRLQERWRRSRQARVVRCKRQMGGWERGACKTPNKKHLNPHWMFHMKCSPEMTLNWNGVDDLSSNVWKLYRPWTKHLICIQFLSFSFEPQRNSNNWISFRYMPQVSPSTLKDVRSAALSFSSGEMHESGSDSRYGLVTLLYGSCLAFG